MNEQQGKKKNACYALLSQNSHGISIFFSLLLPWHTLTFMLLCRKCWCWCFERTARDTMCSILCALQSIEVPFVRHPNRSTNLSCNFENGCVVMACHIRFQCATTITLLQNPFEYMLLTKCILYFVDSRAGSKSKDKYLMEKCQFWICSSHRLHIGTRAMYVVEKKIHSERKKRYRLI